MDLVNLEVNYRWAAGRTRVETMIEQDSTTAHIIRREYDGYTLQFLGGEVCYQKKPLYHELLTFCQHKVEVRTPLEHKLHKVMPRLVPEENSNQIISPMPGKLTAIHIKEGDRVEIGQHLFTLEAMKMQNMISAQRQGIVSSIHSTTGQEVSVDQLVLTMKYD